MSEDEARQKDIAKGKALAASSGEEHLKLTHMINTANAAGAIASLGFFGTVYANSGAGGPVLQGTFWTLACFVIGLVGGWALQVATVIEISDESLAITSRLLPDEKPHPGPSRATKFMVWLGRAAAGAGLGAGIVGGALQLWRLAYDAAAVVPPGAAS